MKNRKSMSLAWLKNELRAEAIKATDEEVQNKLWRWHYRAKNAEYEVSELVLEAEIRRLLEFAVAYGLIDRAVLDDDSDEADKPQATKPKKSNSSKPAADDNLPKQKRLWD